MNEGNVVRLKSGGLNMTIGSIYKGASGQQLAEVNWFGADNHFHKETVQISALEKVQE